MADFIITIVAFEVFGTHSACGGWLASPADIVRFINHVYGNEAILKPETVSAMTTPSVVNPHYARGWFVTEPNRWHSFAERLIGSIRREYLDHIIVLGEAHLRRILKSYARYYNGVRTHRSLNKDAPVSRSVQRSGVIRSLAIFGGPHHHYSRI
jgi:hypothetical protein